MARRKKKTTKAVARDTVTLNSVFTGIANAIREKTGGSDTITPRNMGNAIRGIKGVTEASLPESSLPAVFQEIIPDSLYSSWRLQTNWYAFRNQLVKLSEYNP